MNHAPDQHDPFADLARDLRVLLHTGEQIHGHVQREHQQLKAGAVTDLTSLMSPRQGVLEHLTEAQDRVFAHKADWLRLHPIERQRHPEIPALIRKNLDLIMKIVLLDRENEQQMLRHRMVPAEHLPPPERQKPHYVAKLYNRQP